MSKVAYLYIHLTEDSLPGMERLLEEMRAEGTADSPFGKKIWATVRTLRQYGKHSYEVGDWVRIWKDSKKFYGKIARITKLPFQGDNYRSRYCFQMPNGTIDYEVMAHDLEPAEPEEKHQIAWVKKWIAR